MNKVTKWIREAAKFVVAMVGAVGVTTVVLILEGGITPIGIVTATVSLLTALSVYGVENEVRPEPVEIEDERGSFLPETFGE